MPTRLLENTFDEGVESVGTGKLNTDLIDHTRHNKSCFVCMFTTPLIKMFNDSQYARCFTSCF